METVPGYRLCGSLYNFVTRVCGIDAKKFKDKQGRFIEKDITIEAPDYLLVFGNGSILQVNYVLQPVKTRPMMPPTDILGAEDLKRVLGCISICHFGYCPTGKEFEATELFY